MTATVDARAGRVGPAGLPRQGRPPRTSLPAAEHDRQERPPAAPRTSIGRATAQERFTRTGSWAAGYALSWVICQRVLPLPGPTWWLVVGFVLSLVITAVATSLTEGRVEIADRLAGAVVSAGAGLVGFALLTVLVFVFKQGWQPLTHANFWFRSMEAVGPRQPLTQGGILHAITGSAIEVGIAVLVTVPLGVGTAVFMTEVGGRYAKLVRTVVEAMTALPSIVAGLFIYTVLIITLGLPRSGLCGAMAISVMILPIIARASDVVLRVVPSGLREASLALGASRWRTVWHVVLPTARPGLATALILGVARGVGETSPVLLTSGAATFMVTNPLGGVMNSLPLFVYSTVRSGEPILIQRAFGAASVLLILVLVLFVTARRLARPRGATPGPLTRARRALLHIASQGDPR